MEESIKFRQVKAYFDQNKRLGDSEQNELVRAIIDFFNTKNIRLGTLCMQNLSQQIVAMFPCESPEIYFEKPRNKRARGKLVNRYANSNKNSKKPLIFEEENLSEKKISFNGNGMYQKQRYEN